MGGLVKAAAVLGMSVGSVYKSARQGRIPFFAVGPNRGGIRFDIEEVKAALRQPVVKA